MDLHSPLKFSIFVSGKVVVCFPLFCALLQTAVQSASNHALISIELAFN